MRRVSEKNGDNLAKYIEQLRNKALQSLLDNKTDMDRFAQAVESAFGMQAHEVIEVNRGNGFYPPLRRPAKGSELERHWSVMLQDKALARLESEDPLVFCLELSRRMGG